MEVLEKDKLYHIGRHVGKQGPQSPVGNREVCNWTGNTALIYRAGILLKGNPSNCTSNAKTPIGVKRKKRGMRMSFIT